MIESKEPLYARIYKYILEQIKQETYSPGDQIPTEKELDEMFQVSRITTKKALQMLAQEGYINRVPGRGSFVNSPPKILSKAQAIPAGEKAELHLKPTNKTLYGLILPDFSESFGVDIISGIEQECSRLGIYFLLKRSNGRQEDENQAIDELIDLGVSGLMIMPVHEEYYNTKILRLILDDFPTVIIDRELRGVSSNFVGTDNLQGAKILMEHLFQLGHQEIAFFSPPYVNTSTLEDRVNGIHLAFDGQAAIPGFVDLFLDIACTLPAKNTPELIETDMQKIKEYLQKKPAITAAFAAEYNIAVLVKAAVVSMGKRVPEDFSIVCFDSPGNFIKDYEFTHLQQDQYGIGVEAVQMLWDYTSSKERKIYLEGTLHIGESTHIG